jgi:hypothetical protein
MTTLNVNYTVQGNVAGNSSVDSTFVALPPRTDFGPSEVVECYDVREATWWLLNEQNVGNIVIPPGQPFSAVITPQ